jgi:hypothetical protein
MHTPIFKEILLKIEFEPKYFQEFIQYGRDVLVKDERELENVDKLKRKARDETPIWWYTYECFLYPMRLRRVNMTDIEPMLFY